MYGLLIAVGLTTLMRGPAAGPDTSGVMTAVHQFVDAFNKGATIRPQVAELGKYWSNFCGQDQIYEKGVAPADFVKTATEAANK